ncbi:MAG: efflux RND transporter periplasmic adaptor subunit, partial [Isosphaeraceae bacterium]
MSRIFDALTIAQDQAVEQLTSFAATPDELTDGSSSSWQRTAVPRDDVRFRSMKNHPAELPGKIGLSRTKIRNYLLLAFFALGLVLVGANYAFRQNGSAWANSNQPYGVAFEGTIRPASEIRITAGSIGTVSEISVKIGETVQKGQPLLRMDESDAQLALTTARVERETARENLEKARLAEVTARVAIAQRQEQQVPTRQWRDSPKRAEAVYDQALSNYNRTQQLYEAHVISQQELDARATELRTAQDDLENAKKLAGVSSKLERDQVEQANLEAQVTLRELQQQLRQAELKYRQAEQSMAGTVVRATQDGVVSEIPVRIGDRIPGGTILARISELDHMIAEVPVAAQMISELQVGQPVLVVLSSTPPRQVEGSIRTINPIPSPNMTHVVEVQFANP